MIQHWRVGLLILAFAIASSLVISTVIAYWDYTQDDVFITFTYSRNLARGDGFVFNPGERVQGTTAPLWALTMAVVYRLTPDLLHAGNVLGGIFLIAMMFLVAQLLQDSLSIFAQISLLLLIAATPIFYISLGMETLFYCLLLVLALLFWSKNMAGWALLTAAALTWTRADGLVLGGSFGLLLLWEWHQQQRTFKSLIKLGLIYLVGIAPWFIFARTYFGAFVPQTFNAKTKMFEGTVFLEEAWHWREALYGNNPLHFLALPLMLVGIGVVWRHYSRLRPLVLWTLLYLAGYTILNTSFFWYYTPVTLTCLLLAVIGGDWIVQWIISHIRQPAIITAGALGVVAISTGLGVDKALEFKDPPPRMNTYRLVGEWIDANTERDATVLVGDLGVVGFNAERHILDSFALIVPDMYWQTPDYAAMKYKPDYVVTNTDTMFARFVHQPWFRYHYAPVVQISTRGDAFSPMTIYKRQWPITNPAQIYEGQPLVLNCPVHEAPRDILPKQTAARLYTLDNELLHDDWHCFLWCTYPAPASLGNELLLEQTVLPIPNVPTGRYRWELACDQMHTGEIDILDLSQASNYWPTPDAVWEDFVQLHGVWLPEGNRTWSGGSIAVLLEWEALVAHSSNNYIVNLELIDDEGRVRAGNDSFPTIPTTEWEVGIQTSGIWRIDLPPDIPGGRYAMQVGWYDVATGERVPVGDATAFQLPVEIVNTWPGGSGRP